MEVIRDGTKESRLIGIKGTPGYYACYREISSGEADIWVTKLVQELMPSDTVYGSLFALDRRMIERGGLILHCAYIEHHGKGILFSAPSGVGKSTIINNLFKTNVTEEGMISQKNKKGKNTTTAVTL